MEIITKTGEETQKLGRDFASKLKGGEVVALVGELGSGKTTFVQGLARGLGIKQRIISPTFIIMRQYPIAHQPKSPIAHLYHVDLYRLEQNLDMEIRNLGIDDVWGKEENIVAIEWADKIKNILPKSARWIKFEALGDDSRCISYDTFN